MIFNKSFLSETLKMKKIHSQKNRIENGRQQYDAPVN